MRSNIYGVLWISIGFFAGAFLALATPAHADSTILTNVNTNVASGWGNLTISLIEQSFTAVGTEPLFKDEARYGVEAGSPTMYETLEGDASGFPSGTPLDTSDTQTPAGCSATTTLTFSGGVALVIGVLYHVVGHNQGGTSNVNYEHSCGDNTFYSGGTAERFVVGTGWADQMIDNSHLLFFGTPAAPAATTSTSTASSSLPFNKQETLFMFGIFLFIASVPFWERILHIRNRYV